MFNNAIDNKIIYILGCLAAIFIFFQANFLFHEFQTNINLADMFAICGFIIIILDRNKRINLEFRLPHVKTFLFAASLSFIFAFMVGCYKLGFSNYAFFNKLLGFWVLIGYAALGSLFINLSGNEGIRTILRIIVTTLATILAVQISLNLLILLGLVDISFDHRSLVGYAHNRNAFAIQILSAICLYLPYLKETTRPWKEHDYWLISFLITGTLLTYSRSATITSITLMAFATYFKLINRRQLLTIISQTMSLFLAVLMLEQICNYSCYTLTHDIYIHNQQRSMSMLSIKQYSPVTSNLQRWYTLKEAIILWSKSPLFGIGLGGFVQLELAKHNTYLVIHNTFIWVLAEFGIFGSAAFFWFGVVILKYFRKLFAKNILSKWEMQDKIMLNLLLVFGLMASAHEILYQRILWFIMGMMVIVSHKSGTNRVYS